MLLPQNRHLTRSELLLSLLLPVHDSQCPSQQCGCFPFIALPAVAIYQCSRSARKPAVDGGTGPVGHHYTVYFKGLTTTAPASAGVIMKPFGLRVTRSMIDSMFELDVPRPTTEDGRFDIEATVPVSETGSGGEAAVSCSRPTRFATLEALLEQVLQYPFSHPV